MEWIAFGILLAIVLIIVLFVFSAQDFEWYNLASAILALLLTCATSVTVIVYCFTIWDWLASPYKTQIINREYKTNYTREEIFYASDVIETIRELDRKRIEVNGDLFKK